MADYKPLIILSINDEYDDIISRYTKNTSTGETSTDLPTPGIIVFNEDGSIYYPNEVTSHEGETYSGTIPFVTRTHYLNENKEVPEYIDFNLPSGNLWASCNLGAYYPWDTGLFYQWGATTGYDKVTDSESDSDSEIDVIVNSTWSTAPFNYNNEQFSKRYYNYYKPEYYPEGELVDSKDAAYVATSGEYHMPTKEDFDELVNNVKNKWVMTRGSYSSGNNYYIGRSFYTINQYGNESHKLFIPFTGYYADGKYILGRSFLWSKTEYNTNKKKAYTYNMFQDNYFMDDYYKYFATQIRPIKKKDSDSDSDSDTSD